MTGPLRVDGADGSHFQTNLDLKKAKSAGLKWFANKATQGTQLVDATYVPRRDLARSIGLPFLAYHFGETTTSAKTQALHFLKVAGVKPGDLRPMLDVEDYKSGNSFFSKMSLSQRTDWVEAFVQPIQDELGVSPFIYTRFPLENHFGCPLWIPRYNDDNRSPDSIVPAPWTTWTIWQFTDGVLGSPMSFSGLGKMDLNTFNGDPDRLTKVFTIPTRVAPTPPTPPKPPVVTPDPPKPTPPAPTPPVVKTGSSFNFRVHLVPGNKTQSLTSVINDAALVNTKSPGGSNVMHNTERESAAARLGVTKGLGAGWTRVLSNECTMAYDTEWHQAPGYSDPVAMLLAKDDPSMDGVSPKRYLDKMYLESDRLLTVPVGFFGTHLVSEANCIHVHVKGRKWREKTWAIQVSELVNEVARVVESGVPVVLSGDMNTGVYYTGSKFFELFKKKFGSKAVHIHNGSLDQIIAIGTDKYKLSEVGTETTANNASDHDMVTAVLKLEVL